MKKALIISGLALLLLWGSYQGLAWYGTHQALDRLATTWSDQGDLRWDGIRPRLSGDVEVRGVRWHWFDITRPVTLEKVIIDTPGPQALLRWLWRGQWPEEWALQVTAAEVQLEPDLFRPWARARPSRFMSRPPLALTHCGQRSVLAPADFLQMGIDRVSADLAVHYRRKGGDYFDLDLHAGPLGSIEGQVEMPLSRLIDATAPGSDGLMPDALALTLRDAGFMRRLAAFCAAREDQTPESWAEISATGWQETMEAAGMAPTASLTAFYQEWLKEGGTLQVHWRPDGNVGLSDDEDISADDWRRAQGLELIYNGEEVPEPAVALSAPVREAPPEPVEVSDPELDMTARYHESELERAGAWIDRRVRVVLSSGQTVEGQLTSLDNRYLHIQRVVSGGEIVTPVAVSRIESFSVWRRADDPGRPVSEDDDPAGEPGAVFAPWLEQIEPEPAGAMDDND